MPRCRPALTEPMGFPATSRYEAPRGVVGREPGLAAADSQPFLPVALGVFCRDATALDTAAFNAPKSRCSLSHTAWTSTSEFRPSLCRRATSALRFASSRALRSSGLPAPRPVACSASSAAWSPWRRPASGGWPQQSQPEAASTHWDADSDGAIEFSTDAESDGARKCSSPSCPAYSG